MTGLAVVWANNKVGDRLVVRIDAADAPANPSDDASSNEPSIDTSNLRPKNFLLTGSDNGACPNGDGTAGGIGDRTAFVTVVPLATTLLTLIGEADAAPSADDSSTPTTIAGAPQQQRLGVFPPDDPSCR
ncbi:MAG: hypothetical protein ACKOI3_03890 [Actinomycetota bacterium]